MDKKGEVIISEPYVSADTGEMVLTISQSTKDGSGVVAVDINLNYLQELTNQVKIGDKGYAVLLDKNRKYIAHPTKKVGSEAKEDFIDKMYEKEKGQFDFVLDGEDKILSFATNELTGWKLAGSVAFVRD